MGAIKNNSRFMRGNGIVACDLDGGQALLDLHRSQYYELNSTAALIWEQLESSRTVEELVAAVQREFDVDADRCHGDVIMLLRELRQTGLVDEAGDPAER